MNLFAPVSSLMTPYKNLVIVHPEETLLKIKEIFDKHNFHHIPVVRTREVVGIISKTDFLHFMGGGSVDADAQLINDQRLQHTTAQDIMTKGLGKVESDDRLNVVVDIFTINLFHALPVVDNGELVGIVTPYDILKALSKERVADPSSVYENIVAP